MSLRAHDSKFINRLFVKMHVAYGHLWSSQFVNDEVALEIHAQWSIDLAPYSEAGILRAIDRCKRVYKKAPCLAEFLDILRTDADAAVPVAAWISEPRPACDKTKVADELAEMRRLLGVARCG